MPKRIIRVRLKTYRRSWDLSQDELAALLPTGDRNRVSRVERGLVPPNVAEILACPVIFGRSPKLIFPGHFDEVEEHIIREAVHLQRRLGRATSGPAARKRELVEKMFARATRNPKRVAA